MSWQVIEADCVDAMRGMDEASVDAVVCDPPYNLTFMGKPWDAHDGQEDAGFAYWLSGLIDGEGHFAIKAHGQLSFEGLGEPQPKRLPNQRDGEASAERRYTDRGGSNFAMKPGRRR